MSEIRNNLNTSTAAGTLYESPRSPDRCSLVQQRGPGRHHVTARKKWSKEKKYCGNGIILLTESY